MITLYRCLGLGLIQLGLSCFEIGFTTLQLRTTYKILLSQVFESFVIDQPDTSLYMVSSSATSLLCNGDTTAVLTISVAGGTLDYNYLWTNGDTTNISSNLGAGNYNVTVTDNNG